MTEFGYEFSYEPIDNPAILHAVRQAGIYDSADLQITPDGKYAAFASLVPIDGYDSGGHYEVFRYDATAGADPQCLSCSVTTARADSDATLTPHGSSLADDGRVFFTSVEQLVLRDTNDKTGRLRVGGRRRPQLISTGTSNFDSACSRSAPTARTPSSSPARRSSPQDDNGEPMKIYDAREGGGFLRSAAGRCARPRTSATGPARRRAAAARSARSTGNGGNVQAEARPSARRATSRSTGQVRARRSTSHKHRRATQDDAGEAAR